MDGDWHTRPVKSCRRTTPSRGVRNARQTLEAGFTTVRDLGARGFTDVALAKRSTAACPRAAIVPAGHAIGITGGHCDETGWAPGIFGAGPEAGSPTGPSRLYGRSLSGKYGAESHQDLRNRRCALVRRDLGAQQLSDEEMSAIVEEATRQACRSPRTRTAPKVSWRRVRRGRLDRAWLVADRRRIALMKREGHLPGSDAYTIAVRQDASRDAAGDRRQDSRGRSACAGQPSARRLRRASRSRLAPMLGSFRTETTPRNSRFTSVMA